MLNLNIYLLEHVITDYVLFGIQPRIENPILNLRLRKASIGYNTKYYSIGNITYTSFPITNLVLNLVR